MFDFLKPTLSDSQLLAQANTAFAIDLYHQLRRENSGNLFFSPFSLSTALAMTWAGARSQTAEQMGRALHLSQIRNSPFGATPQRLHLAYSQLLSRLAEIQAHGQVLLHTANALWPKVDYPFLAGFIDLCQAHYGVSITPLDFTHSQAARQVINDWTAAQTAGKIQDLIPEGVLNSLTRLVLTNAVYFKGAWSNPFDAAITRPASFYAPGGETQVELMWQSGQFGYARRPGLQVLELPYQGKEISMLLLLPDAQDGLPALEAELTPARLENWLDPVSSQRVMVFLPRFRSQGDYLLNEPLQTLGMVDAFDEAQADFSGMDGIPHWLSVKAVLQKAFVEVNEAGTEAAAAAAVVMAQRSAQVITTTFRADHPFLFLIRENETGSILFLGRLVHP